MEVKNCRTIQSVEVGQTIYLKPVGNAQRVRGDTSILEATVTKVGKKYFYVEGAGIWGREHRFTVDGGDGYDHDRNYGYVPYESLTAYKADLRYNEKMLQLRKYFSSTYTPTSWPSMEAVEKIWEILAAEGKLKEEP